MIKSLSISNYALIDNITIGFEKGFTCLTGETGAGKSIILGAISLVLGERADTKVLYDKDKKCVIEAVFCLPHNFSKIIFEENDIDFNSDCIIRREISSQGKSRIFINDSPVSLNVLKSIGLSLIDLHSQDQKFSLSDNSQQLHFLDNFITDKSIFDNYYRIFNSYSELCRKKAYLQSEYEKINMEQDYYSFLYNELYEANLSNDEDILTEKELSVLDNAELIKEKLNIAINLLYNDDSNVVDITKTIINNFSSISSFVNNGVKLLERLEDIKIETKDISDDLIRLNNSVFVDLEKSEELRNRLDFINKLLYKHKVNNVNELIEIRNDLSLKLSNTNELYIEIEKITKEIEFLYNDLKHKAEILSKSRKSCAEIMSLQISNILKDLGITKNNFEITVSKTDNYTITGNNFVEFLFSANIGSPLAPLSSVASGGELSRVMLALKSIIAIKNDIPTVIFDEIDSGVSGITADAVAAKLREISKNIQVISISHLPQIAAKADAQFLVYKEELENRTFTRVKLLNNKERINAIASMLSGSNVTAAAIENAVNLLGF
ncbi:MAG: DNA repair protein RecN [Bacteroidales bacterium]|nr:DNA repair protein RecN [Bacteroidales bacterium]